MRLSRLLPGLAAALTLALGVTLNLPSADAAAAPPCQEGTVEGDWDLPSGITAGFVEGKLVDNATGMGVYKMTGSLTATPSPCLACIQGVIYGYLDDGFGPAPDYIVKGAYNGAALTGDGSWWAYIYEPTGAGPVGKMAGVFSDPPFPAGVGAYKGEWVICP